MRNKSLAVLTMGILMYASVPLAVAGAKTTSTWGAPDLQPGAYAKFLVLARITDETAKRILEDTVVAKLKGAKTDAVAAWQVLVPEDLSSDAAIHAKAEQLGVDASIVFTVTADETRRRRTPPSPPASACRCASAPSACSSVPASPSEAVEPRRCGWCR